MKKMYKIMLLLSVVFLMGCGKDSGDETTDAKNNLIFIVSNTAGSKLYDYEAFRDVIKDTYRSGGTVNIIQLDATPQLVEEHLKVDSTELRGKSETNKQNLCDLYACATTSVMNTLQPDSEGTNIVGAFQQAGYVVDETAKNTIYICNNMISTELVDMKAGVSTLADQAEEVVKSLRESYDMPDLQTCHIEIYGAGEMSLQPNLSNHDINQLEKFYTRLFEEAGCESINFNRTTLPENTSLSIDEEYSNFPIIPSQNTGIIIKEISKANETIQFEKDVVIVIDEESVRFKPDTDEFVDLEQTKKTLTPLVESISLMAEAKTGEKVCLIGTTAASRVNSKGDQKLSLARAVSVQKLLIQLGAPNDIFEAYGVGFNESFGMESNFTNGKFDEYKAVENRTVIVTTDSNSLGLLAKEAAAKGEIQCYVAK